MKTSYLVSFSAAVALAAVACAEAPWFNAGFGTYAPGLGAKRTYTIFGKTNLADRIWLTPAPDGARFFRVKVDLPLQAASPAF